MAYEDVLPTRLRMERARIKKTQKQVAEETGIAASAICNYENGDRVPTLQTLAQLADFYDASIDYLVGK
jgi:repressor LexA